MSRQVRKTMESGALEFTIKWWDDWDKTTQKKLIDLTWGDETSEALFCIRHDKKLRTCVVFLKGRVVGWSYRRWRMGMCATGVFVDKIHRKQGIGTALIKEIRRPY